MTKQNHKSATGVTPTEQLLLELCSKSFLRLWSYANPYKDDGHEFCDVLVVFENHVFIFFDREKPFTLPDGPEQFSVAWERWKRSGIAAQVRTAHGAERYLRSKRSIFLDAKKERPFPLAFNYDTLIVHKIIVAHGVADACKTFSADNVSGSLAVAYGDRDEDTKFPFLIALEREHPVHVLDSSSLPILLGELDTTRDFTNYLDAKHAAISKLMGLVYCGEEDLLGHYFLNLGPDKKHFIGASDPSVNFLGIEEGTWEDFKRLPQYKATKAANRTSYLWDHIIDKTCDNFLQGKLLGDSDLYGQRSAIIEMAKEPRFMRRALADWMRGAIDKFPEVRSEPNRLMRYMPSIEAGRGYVFLQLWIPERLRTNEENDRAKRQEILGIACGAAKNKMPELQTVVGIGIEPPKLVREIGEDFVLLDCAEWPDERKKEFEERNQGWNFFQTDALKQYKNTAYEFVLPAPREGPGGRAKPGRNEPCPCGSGKKYKRCHGR